jgi:hypothetical protein
LRCSKRHRYSITSSALACRVNGRAASGDRCRGRKEAPKAVRSSDKIAAAHIQSHGRPSANLRMLYAACRSRNSAVRRRKAGRTAAPRGTLGRCRAVPSCSRYWSRSLFPAGANNSSLSTFLPATTRNFAHDRPVFDLAQISTMPGSLNSRDDLAVWITWPANRERYQDGGTGAVVIPTARQHRPNCCAAAARQVSAGRPTPTPPQCTSCRQSRPALLHGRGLNDLESHVLRSVRRERRTSPAGLPRRCKQAEAICRCNSAACGKAGRARALPLP